MGLRKGWADVLHPLLRGLSVRHELLASTGRVALRQGEQAPLPVGFLREQVQEHDIRHDHLSSHRGGDGAIPRGAVPGPWLHRLRGVIRLHILDDGGNHRGCGGIAILYKSWRWSSFWGCTCPSPSAEA